MEHSLESEPSQGMQGKGKAILHGMAMAACTGYYTWAHHLSVLDPSYCTFQRETYSPQVFVFVFVFKLKNWDIPDKFSETICQCLFIQDWWSRLSQPFPGFLWQACTRGWQPYLTTGKRKKKTMHVLNKKDKMAIQLHEVMNDCV